MTWRLAESLHVLRGEVNKRWPGRDKTSDGTVGDPAHSARDSDHNPNDDGVVRAFDCDASAGVGQFVAEHVRRLGSAGGHPALGPGAYVIYDGRIASDAQGWVWRTYAGSNPHTTHVHVSVATAAAGYDSPKPWGVYTPVVTTPFPLPAGHVFGRDGRRRVWIHDGAEAPDREHVRRIQAKFPRLERDGIYGKTTAEAVRGWQLRRGYPDSEATGTVSSREWRRLGL